MSLLVVAAHPDDEVLGCGGTIHRAASDGIEVHVLLMGAGVTARYEAPTAEAVAQQQALTQSTARAAALLGVDRIWRLPFPDNRFDTVPLLELAKEVEHVIDAVEPDMVFTHHPGDLNVDHRRTAEAVLTATRPQPPIERAVSDLFTFPVLSSTEWAFGLSPQFTPRRFVQLDADDVQAKLRALEAYGGEMRAFPHRRSIVMASTGLTWYGSMMGVEAAEAFDVARSLRPLAFRGSGA